MLCPSLWPRLPGSRLVEPPINLKPKPYAGYLATFNNTRFVTGDAGHLFLGGQPTPFSMKGRVGEHWPRPGAPRPDPEMRLPPYVGRWGGNLPPATIIRRAMVGGRSSLVLQPDQYPRAGIHGGHVVVVWNQDARGYLVSLHFGGRPEPTPYRLKVPKRFRYTPTQRIEAALRLADSAASGG